MAGLLAVVLVVQFRTRRYVPSVYWLAVVLISIVGTLITDNLVDNFGVSLVTTTVVFSVALAATFAAWYAKERTLSIHTIVTSRREGFYWLAILFTFALGTAAGDLVAEGFALGYGVSALMFGALIGVITLSYYKFGTNAVLAFWIAYILTRPLGASIGDLLSQPTSRRWPGPRHHRDQRPLPGHHPRGRHRVLPEREAPSAGRSRHRRPGRHGLRYPPTVGRVEIPPTGPSHPQPTRHHGSRQ